MQWLYNTITRLLLAIIVSLLLISIILSYVSKVGHAKALARVASAAEINYGSVQKAEGGRLIIKYSGPAGEITFSCDLTGSCAPFSEIAAALPMGTKIAESEDGRYVLGVLNVHAGAVFYSYYSLYERSGGTYVFKALLPIYEPTLSIRFAPANSALVFATISGRLGSYNISTGQSFTAQTSQREFPFLTFSQNGKYASFYNYVSASHKVWDLESKTSREIKGKPSLIEFNSGATLAVYADDESGYDNVYSSVPGSGTTAP